MSAWWSGSAADLCSLPAEVVIGCLARRLVETHMVNHDTQISAWRAQLFLLRDALRSYPDWRVLLEYPLLRLGRRIDAVVLSDRAILVVEFKIGATAFLQADMAQVEDYALDLQDFHMESRAYPIIPILTVTGTAAPRQTWPLFLAGVASSPVLLAGQNELGRLCNEIHRNIPPPLKLLDAVAWEQAAYRPVPTIVEAASMLYRKHGVSEIKAASSDKRNLRETSAVIQAAVAEAAAQHSHAILFVTGIPGAGKTLCGLDAVFHAEHEAAFLTGNLPLVHVLREALARDAHETGMSLRAARHKVESAVQPLLGFLRDNVQRHEPPHEHVIVFDEAQRAWDAAFGQRKFGLDDSEAALFLDIMRRHRDWSVIIALVGGGQEINTGEAGLVSWGEALAIRPEWKVIGPPDIIAAADAARSLFAAKPPEMVIDPHLHLDVSVRQIRAPAAAAWIDAVLDGDAGRAAAIAAEAVDLPFKITRSIAAMQEALRYLARGERRAGLVCSADAKRLRADGLWPDFPHLDQDAVANWFLNRWPDVRASDALEIPATQYACQGLELDYVGLCWGGDLCRLPGQAGWQARKFKGTKWQALHRADAVRWQINTYRVLLTRARYETIIFVPKGDADDRTRNPVEFDAIADFLLRCGVEPLDHQENRMIAAPAQLVLL